MVIMISIRMKMMDILIYMFNGLIFVISAFYAEKSYLNQMFTDFVKK
jgi:hypothetical protein